MSETPENDTPVHTADEDALRKKRKRERRKAAEEARVAAAVREARAEWESEHAAGAEAKRGNLLRRPVVIALTAASVALLVAATVLTVLYVRESAGYDDLAARDADKVTAQDIAGKYAVGAATVDYGNLDKWSGSLKSGTAKEVNSRLDVAVKTLTPLFQEVQWSQSADLIAATTVDVRDDRQFVVQVFISTRMTSTQNPKGINTITPYTITLDRDDNWAITDVAGINDVPQDGSIGAGAPELAKRDDPGHAAPEDRARGGR